MYIKALVWLFIAAVLAGVSIPIYQWLTTPTLPDAFDGWAEDCQFEYGGSDSVEPANPNPEYEVPGVDLDQYGDVDDKGRVYGMTNDLSAAQEIPEDQDHSLEHPMFPVRVTGDKVEVLPVKTYDVEDDRRDALEIIAVSQDGKTIHGAWGSGIRVTWHCE